MVNTLPIDPDIYEIVKQKQLELIILKRRPITLTEINNNLVLLGLTHTEELIEEIK